MPKIMAQYPKVESIGSIGSIVLGIFGGPGICVCRKQTKQSVSFGEFPSSLHRSEST